MKDPGNKIAVLVAGPHRGGTSAAARALSLLGCDLPKTLMQASPENNETGFWESLPVMELNDEILASAGTVWDDWQPIAPDWNACPVAEEFRERAQALLGKEFGASQLFVLKDPRICRLLPFWAGVLQAFGAEPRILLPVRNPLDVAASLEARDGIHPSLGLLIWLRHALDAEAASRGLKRAFLRYERLLKSPEAQLARLGAALAIVWPKGRSLDAEMGIDEFLSPSLRHQRREDASLLENAKLSHWLRSSFEILNRWARDEARPVDQAALDRIRSAFDEALPAFGRALVSQRRALARLAKTAAERGDQIQALHEKVGGRDARIEGLLRMASQQDGEIQALRRKEDELRQKMSEQEAEVRALHEKVGGRDAKIEELLRMASQQDEELAELRRGLAARNREIEQLHQAAGRRDGRIATLEGIVDDLLGSRSWRFSAPLRLPRRIVQLLRTQGRAWLGRTARRAYRLTPLPHAVKRLIKSGLFRIAGPLFRHAAAYRHWQLAQGGGQAPDPQTAAEGRAIRARVHWAARDQYVSKALDEIDPRQLSVRLIAFYLPQFHPIPENDQWWGAGFTEWINVTNAQPNYEGHYQPRQPADLGYYDLRVAEVMEQQADLARRYGIHGFCYHYYWFGGRRLLEMPLERMLETGRPDFPFCLCWANENWTRRWDGHEHEVLMAQSHGDEDDEGVIRDLMRYFRHPNYIRVNGKPLFLLYRASLFPDIRRTARRWRALCREEGIGEICLALVESFELAQGNDAAKMRGFDAAVEFPPHQAPSPMNPPGPLLNPEFAGWVNDYRAIAEMHLAKPHPNYLRLRGLMPGWDNTARRQNHAHIFHHASPEAYRAWLQGAIEQTCERCVGDERLIFINAWNEWAEGAYLEPDRRYGYAYLQATREALEQTRPLARRELLFVIHDACANGAQYNALAMIAGLAEKLDARVHIGALGGGALLHRFEQLGRVHRLWEADDPILAAAGLARDLKLNGTDCAILNSAASGALAGALARAGLRVVSLIHELPRIIASRGLEPAVENIARHAHLTVFAAEQVRQGFEQFAPLRNEVRIRPQGLYKINRYRSSADRTAARWMLRAALNLPREAQVIIGVGYGDLRKGADLFLAAARRVAAQRPGVQFVWVGDLGADLPPEIREGLAGGEDRSPVRQIDHVEDTDLHYAGADLLALTSREDPFPSVALEAMDAGLPVVGFDGVGGLTDLLREGAGALAPPEDAAAFAEQVLALLQDRERARQLGDRGRELIRERFGWSRYLVDLANMAGLATHRVSVIVPNFNYLRYLAERLSSIAVQTYPIYELIVLDDASTDGSREWLAEEAARRFPEARIVCNERNSGSAFAQWRKGAQLAKGDILWIAEADDLCEPDFLRAAVASFDDSQTVLSYCQSKQMLGDGSIASEDYLAYTDDISTDKWRRDHSTEAVAEIPRFFAVKNPVPNVSGVLFRRQRLLAVMDDWFEQILQLRTAGDWLTYILCLERGGRIAFHAEALNLHRRHDDGIILSSGKADALGEILAVQRFVAERCGVAEPVAEQARRYAEELYAQFGLSEAANGALDDIAQSAPKLAPAKQPVSTGPKKTKPRKSAPKTKAAKQSTAPSRTGGRS